MSCPAPRSGIQIKGAEFEWRQAAHWGHLTFRAFRMQLVEEQEAIIAAYRANQQMEGVLAWANRPRKKPK